MITLAVKQRDDLTTAARRETQFRTPQHLKPQLTVADSVQPMLFTLALGGAQRQQTSTDEEASSAILKWGTVLLLATAEK